ncbi:MAG: hypothetical protein ACRDD7_03055 [Peptostreptococcaceae bacterium]
MYKCIKCNNVKEFEEINVVKTYMRQNETGEVDHYISDEFFYRENVVCLECLSTMEDGNVIEQ